MLNGKWGISFVAAIKICKPPLSMTWHLISLKLHTLLRINEVCNESPYLSVHICLMWSLLKTWRYSPLLCRVLMTVVSSFSPQSEGCSGQERFFSNHLSMHLKMKHGKTLIQNHQLQAYRILWIKIIHLLTNLNFLSTFALHILFTHAVYQKFCLF